MKKKMLWQAVALMMVTTLMGCTKEDNGVLSNEDNERKDVLLTRDEEQLVCGSNEFAFNLFRQVMADQKMYKSEILSPISITYALGMLNNGAAGETQAQINKVLGFGETGADGINDFCRKMLMEAPKLDCLTKVMIANNIYMNKDYQLKDEFKTQARDYYDAEAETRDFADGQTMNVINQWASDHTEGMIEKVLSENEFDPMAVSYLLNAIYFKGAWQQKFDMGETIEEEFRRYNAEKMVIMKPMMHQKHEFGYTENDDCQALCMPYGNGAFIATFLLPREGKTVSEILKSLTTSSWQHQYRWMSTAEVDVKLPRFETKSDVNLNDVMASLGMPNAFSTLKAEFPNFCNVPIFIDLMKQVARIKVNEEGTEAAAVTVIATKDIVPDKPKYVKFHANRPFLYVISEQSTGAIFFIGQYMGD